MTDNKNRIASDMRIATNKRGGTIANPGSVAFNFDRKGVIYIVDGNEEELFMQALDSGAEDFTPLESGFMVITAPDSLFEVKETLEENGVACREASLEMIPKTLIACDKETQAANEALIEWLEELDDVDAVFHNME